MVNSHTFLPTFSTDGDVGHNEVVLKTPKK
jgi:hypothetical protein